MSRNMPILNPVNLNPVVLSPMVLGIVVLLATISLLFLSGCKTAPTRVDDPQPESSANRGRFEMVNGVLMRVNELPSSSETRKQAEFEKVRQDILKREAP